MRRDLYLENGISCIGEFEDFKLYYNEVELTPSCNDIAYIPNTLIVIKTNKKIIVYKPKVFEQAGNFKLFEIANFESKTPDVKLEVKINNKTFIITYNAQIFLQT